MNIIINGAGGRMGKALQVMAGSKAVTVAAAVDPFVTEGGILPSLESYSGTADCILDFSNHAGTKDLCAYGVKKQIPLVIATTGHTQAELEIIQETAKTVPVFWSGNFSVGIALLASLARQTARMFPDADIEIVESHHNQKLDVPSGTALMLARAIREARPEAEFLVGRHENGKREKKEIGIHSLRMGNTVGIHEIIVNTGTQIITLKHEAQDRSLFAEGALAAAAFLVEQAPGLYGMEDLLKRG